MVERGGLENRCARKRTGGSNPSPSAIHPPHNRLCLRFRPQKRPELRDFAEWLLTSRPGGRERFVLSLPVFSKAPDFAENVRFSKLLILCLYSD